MYKKIFVVFEGIDGSGKTSHSLKIANKIKSLKIPCLHLREPGGSNEAEKIRKFLLKNSNSGFNSLTDTLLYLSARNENVLKKIKPYYKKKIIICDRYVDSTIAYQHYGFGVKKKIINFLNKEITGKIRPDFTFLMHSSVNRCISRTTKKKRNNRYDRFNANFYKKVQSGFLKISKKNKKKYMIIDSSRSFIDNQKIILSKIYKLMHYNQ